MTKEQGLLCNVLVMCLCSLSILFKIGHNLFFNQIFKIAIALGLIYAISKIFCETFFALAQIIYLGCILLLALNLLGMGTIKRWTNIGGFFIQFSEFAKIGMILMLSKFLANHHMTFPNLIKALIIIFIPAFLIFKQPNLGTTIIFVATGLGMIWIRGINRKILIASFISMLATIPIIWHKMLPYQKARIFAFLNKSADPKGSSYQTIQSITAIGAGGLFGSNALHNKLGFVPENHTDFLFSYFAENYGFVITIFLLLLIANSLIKLLEIIYLIHDYKKQLFCAGFFILWFVQIFMNIGMNIGILPVTGIVLPFFSYGGSSLIAFMMFIGIIMNFMKHNQLKG